MDPPDFEAKNLPAESAGETTQVASAPGSKPADTPPAAEEPKPAPAPPADEPAGASTTPAGSDAAKDSATVAASPDESKLGEAEPTPAESAPAPELFRHFGFTPEAVAAAVKKVLN